MLVCWAPCARIEFKIEDAERERDLSCERWDIHEEERDAGVRVYTVLCIIFLHDTAGT